MITLEQAKALQYGQTLYSSLHRNADGSPRRWRVNGKVRTWKLDPNRVEVPVRHGLYSYDTIRNNSTLNLVCLTEEEALKELNA